MLFSITPIYDDTTRYTNYYANSILFHNTILANGDMANKSVFNKIMREYDIDTILTFGHGVNDAILGQHNEPMIDLKNVDLLNGKIVVAFSCSSAKELGKSAIEKGAKCFIGYDEPFAFTSRGTDPNDKYVKDFMVIGIMPAKLLLDGNDTSTAYKLTKEYYQKVIDKWANSTDPTASLILSFLIHNKKHLKFLGVNSKPRIRDGHNYEVKEKKTIEIGLLALLSLLSIA